MSTRSAAFLRQFQKPKHFTITFFPTGIWLFSQVAASISLGLASGPAGILSGTEGIALCVWLVTHRERSLQVDWLFTVAQNETCSLVCSQWFLKRVKQHILKVEKCKDISASRLDFLNATI